MSSDDLEPMATDKVEVRIYSDLEPKSYDFAIQRADGWIEYHTRQHFSGQA